MQRAAERKSVRLTMEVDLRIVVLVRLSTTLSAKTSPCSCNLRQLSGLYRILRTCLGSFDEGCGVLAFDEDGLTREPVCVDKAIREVQARARADGGGGDAGQAQRNKGRQHRMQSILMVIQGGEGSHTASLDLYRLTFESQPLGSKTSQRAFPGQNPRWAVNRNVYCCGRYARCHQEPMPVELVAKRDC